MDASDLINTASPSPGAQAAALEAWQSWDYYHGDCYPRHAFNAQQWPPDKGPIPTPLPYVKTLADEGAEFVFSGGNPSFAAVDLPQADELLQKVIRQNRLPSQWVALATDVANQGTIAAKFAFLPDDKTCPVRISFLKVPTECRVWVDPHDQSRLLMARIQYPYRDPGSGRWLYYREEWTDDEYVTYLPKEAGDRAIVSPLSLPGYMDTFGDGDGWEIQTQSPNLFGLIPITLIRNKTVAGAPLGVGDCWGLFRLIDRIALAMHREDRHNQKAEGRDVFLNAVVNLNDAVQPGEPLDLQSTKGSAAPAGYEWIEPTGASRQWSQADIEKREALLYDAAGMSRIDPQTLTNKGNMTRLALMTAYSRTISTSNRKRTAWGEDGMAHCFRNLLIAMARVGDLRGVDEDALDVSVSWPDYFAATDDDLSQLTDRTVKQVSSGMLPKERGAQRLAVAEGVPANEVDNLLAELKAEAGAQAAAEAEANEDAAASDGGEEVAEAVDGALTNSFTA